MRRALSATWLGLALLTLGGGCGSDDDGEGGGSGGTGSPDNTGKECTVPDDCYPDLDPSLLSGAAQCLDRVPGGYCTHLCEADTDCCAVEGECETTLPQVCSPFEASGMKMCFLSCEAADLPSGDDPESFCQREASTAFICRSSGGGSNNRKICVPGDCGVGESCAGDADCESGLNCLTEHSGGYCGRKDCATNADCPPDAACTKLGDTNYCLRRCTAETDCSFCRHPDFAATCRDDVSFVEAGTAGSVCVPP